MRRPGWDSRPGQAQPHVDGASLGVVEGRLGSVTPALACSRCSGAAIAATTATTAVEMTTAAAATGTATPAAATPTTTASAASAGGVRGRGPPKGAGEDGG
jgi:hypothetical protein